MATHDAQDSIVLLDDLDWSDYITEFQGPGARGMNNAAVLSSAGQKRLPSQDQAQFSAAGIFEDTVFDVDISAFKGAANGYVLQFWPGGGAIGEGGQGATVKHGGSEIRSRVGNLVEVAGLQMPSEGPARYIRSLHELATRTANLDHTSVDWLAGSTNGAEVFINIISNTATGGNAQWLIAVDHSTDDAAWAEKWTTTYASGVVGGVHSTTLTGTLNRYTRLGLTLDATSGSIRFAMGLYRLP